MARISRQSSTPFISGMETSVITRSGFQSCGDVGAFDTVGCNAYVVALGGECGAKYPNDLRLIVHDEYLCWPVMFGRLHSRSLCCVTM